MKAVRVSIEGYMEDILLIDEKTVDLTALIAVLWQQAGPYGFVQVVDHV